MTYRGCQVTYISSVRSPDNSKLHMTSRNSNSSGVPVVSALHFFTACAERTVRCALRKSPQSLRAKCAIPAVHHPTASADSSLRSLRSGDDHGATGRRLV